MNNAQILSKTEAIIAITPKVSETVHITCNTPRPNLLPSAADMVVEFVDDIRGVRHLVRSVSKLEIIVSAHDAPRAPFLRLWTVCADNETVSHVSIDVLLTAVKIVLSGHVGVLSEGAPEGAK
jgi:hypothetical protein